MLATVNLRDTMPESFLFILATPLLIFLAALVGWVILRAANELFSPRYEKYKQLFATGVLEIGFGYVALSTGCEPKHLNFGQCFNVPPVIGYMAILCGIFTILCGFYLRWKENHKDRSIFIGKLVKELLDPIFGMGLIIMGLFVAKGGWLYRGYPVSPVAGVVEVICGVVWLCYMLKRR